MAEKSKNGGWWHIALAVLGVGGHIASFTFAILEHAEKNAWFWSMVAFVPLALTSSIIFAVVKKNELKALEKTQAQALDILSVELDKTRIELAKTQKELTKAEKYKKAFPALNKAFREIHIASWNKSMTYPDALNGFCNILANIFTNITGSPCHVAIKVCAKNADSPKGITSMKEVKKLEVETVARDSDSLSERMGKRRQGDHIRHTIKENTDFLKILKQIDSGGEAIYYSHNLIDEPNYHNSSFKCYGKPHDVFGQYASKEQKEKDWLLEYKSTIVVPIYPGTGSSPQPTNNLYGFLCVHSKDPHIFDEKIDNEIMKGCADGLINIIDGGFRNGGLKPIP